MHAINQGGTYRAPHQKRGKVRLILASLFATLMAVTGAITLPVAAAAAQNTAIIVDQVTVGDGSGPDGQLMVGDTVTISGAWDASAANPQRGDTFSIGLPAELRIPVDVPFNLTGPRPDGSEAIWATCYASADENQAECTLTAEVEPFPELVMGEFSFDVEAVLVSHEKEVTFDLNGRDVAVPLPGAGGIDDGVVLPDDWSKTGQMNPNNWSMTWTIELPGTRLEGLDSIAIDDVLGAGHTVCDLDKITVHTVRGSEVIENVSSLASAVPGADEQQFTITLNAPERYGFDPNVIYRISYETCTTNGQIDPAGTEYTNEAFVPAWGESSGPIGVQSPVWQQAITKNGTVLDGVDRYGKIAWTVTIPGDKLVGKTDFSFVDQLGAGHLVCGDTLSNMRVIEQYGPSNQVRDDITDKVIKTGQSTTADAFGFRMRFSDPARQFLASDYRYLISYTTCVEQDDLPAAGTVFHNTAEIDGEAAPGSAEVPGRKDDKSGQIGTKKKTIDGIEYLPQTTIDWTITVPGERLSHLSGPLTVTDELSASHQVCEAGDPTAGVIERLKFTLTARDQVQGGGLANEPLTSTVNIDAQGQSLTFTVPEPTLTQPDGSARTGFSTEYDYVFRYTTCTTSGGMDAPGTVYGNAAVVAGKTYDSSVTQNNRGSGTGQGVTRGSVAVEKSLAGTAGDEFVPADAKFSVHVQEFDPTGVLQIEYDLEVSLDGTPVSGPNSRGRGWTALLSEPSLPSYPGVVFGEPRFAAGPGITLEKGGTEARVALDPGTNVRVGLTNESLLGSLSITKQVEGAASGLVDPDRLYRVTAVIDTSALGAGFPPQPNRVVDVKAGTPTVLENLPIGSVVTLSEAVPADDDAFTWDTPVFSPETVTISDAHAHSAAEVTLTNSVSRTTGTFALEKTVTGAQAANPAVPAEVTVEASWTEEGVAGSKTLTLPTDGTPVPFGENLLIGTEVTLTEQPLSDGSSIAWAAPTWAGTGVSVNGTSAIVTIGRDADATVTLENHAATSDAGLSLIKSVAGEASGEVDPTTEFPVVATWTDAAGVDQKRDLTINAVTPTSLGEELPAGTVVTITEGDRPQIDTVVWGSITINGNNVTDNGDGSAQIIVSDQQSDNTLVTVTNEATWAPGTFSVTKSITGVLLDNPDVPADVTVVATWFEAGQPVSESITVPTDGTETPFGVDLPYGTAVTLSEEPLADADAFHWLAPTWESDGAIVNGDDTVTIVIGAATDIAVGLTNHAEASLGDLTIVKALEGDGAADVAADTAFPVIATWTDLLGEQQQVEVNVTAGEPVVLTEMPLGTEVTLVEKPGTLPSIVKWVGAAWAAQTDNATVTGDNAEVVLVITDDPDASAAVTLTNTIDRLPDLAVTGGGAIAAGAIVLILALIGGGFLLLRNRERQA